MKYDCHRYDFQETDNCPTTMYTQFYVLLTVHPCTFLQINPTRCTILLSIFISLLYMFRTTMCPSSGEITVSMRHWYLSLCMGGFWSAGWSFTPTKQNCAPSWIYLQDCSISFLPEITLGVLRDAKQKGGKYLNICC